MFFSLAWDIFRPTVIHCNVLVEWWQVRRIMIPPLSVSPWPVVLSECLNIALVCIGGYVFCRLIAVWDRVIEFSVKRGTISGHLPGACIWTKIRQLIEHIHIYIIRIYFQTGQTIIKFIFLFFYMYKVFSGFIWMSVSRIVERRKQLPRKNIFSSFFLSNGSPDIIDLFLLHEHKVATAPHMSKIHLQRFHSEIGPKLW